jgi:F-type H+-transporting ATPase subunit b
VKNKSFLLLAVTLVCAAALGAEHEGHEAAEELSNIPWEQIGWQAANLGILVVAMIFFLRQSIIDAFRDRQKNYIDASEKTKSALVEAEKALSGIKDKLALLENGEASALQTAQHESNLMKVNLIKEAEHSAEKLKKEASMHIASELNKAKAEINAEILVQAIGLSEKNLSQAAATSVAKQEASFLKQLEQVKA